MEKLKMLLEGNFNLQKTIQLESDVDENNCPCTLPAGFNAYWTELINPTTEEDVDPETVEAKVYIAPQKIPAQVLIICPGYKGDFVLQEGQYVDELGYMTTAIVVLRHNALRIAGEDMQNYIHCPQKVAHARTIGQGYLGSGKELFSYAGASREVLIALKALNLKTISAVDILGASWGARIGLLSLAMLAQEEGGDAVAEKVRSFIALGPSWETDEKRIEMLREPLWLAADEQAGYFQGMTVDIFLRDMRITGEQLRKLKASHLPEGLELSVICSLADRYLGGTVGIMAEVMPIFQQLELEKELIILGNLTPSTSKTIGGRLAKVHDYNAPQVRKTVSRIVNS